MPNDNVFTILNHGTKSHRSRRDGEIIADFGRNMDGDEYNDYLITDGPGSGWMGAKKAPKSSKRAHPMPGDFDPFDRFKGKKKSAPTSFDVPSSIFIFQRVVSLGMHARPYWRVAAPGVGATTMVPEPPGLRHIMNLLVT